MAEHKKSNAVQIAALAFCTAILFTGQVLLAALPNIEIVSLLILLYTKWFQKQALVIIYVFVLLEGIFYGFHLWWFGYLYIWLLLWILGMFLSRAVHSKWVWAAAGGVFGLGFGFFFSLVYLFTGGIHVAFGWWVAGIPFDIIHGVGNFILILCLFSPLDLAYKSVLKVQKMNPQRKK